MLHYFESACDAPADRGECSVLVKPFVCEHCADAFASVRALKSHARRKHGARIEQRFYADADGLCQVCHAQFGSRLRLIAHLSDRRRPKCWLALCHNRSKYRRLSDSAVQALSGA